MNEEMREQLANESIEGLLRLLAWNAADAALLLASERYGGQALVDWRRELREKVADYAVMTPPPEWLEIERRLIEVEGGRRSMFLDRPAKDPKTYANPTNT